MRRIMWKGEYRSIVEIAKLEGIHKGTLTNRIGRGISVSTAVAMAHGKKIKNGRKPWREMSENEIALLKARKCLHCTYSNGSAQEHGIGSLTCDYIDKTGHRRGCDPRDCEFWKEEGERKRRRAWN